MWRWTCFCREMREACPESLMSQCSQCFGRFSQPGRAATASEWSVVSCSSAENQFERFRWFLELISRFEFEFRRCGNYFFEQFEFFGVFKVQSHTMWPYMCLCCGLFAPTQSHSNVVASVTIHDDKCIYIYLHIYIYVCVHVCVYICVYVCVYVCKYVYVHEYVYVYV